MGSDLPGRCAADTIDYEKILKVGVEAKDLRECINNLSVDFTEASMSMVNLIDKCSADFTSAGDIFVQKVVSEMQNYIGCSGLKAHFLNDNEGIL